MKKILGTILMIGALLLFVTGCSNDNLTYTPEEILEKVYANVEELPMLQSQPLTVETLEYNLGLKELDFKEGVVSEPPMTSIAHSVVVVRVNEGVDVEKVKADIKANINPAKWLCTEAEQVIVESKGDVIILIMSFNTTAPAIAENFRNLK